MLNSTRRNCIIRVAASSNKFLLTPIIGLTYLQPTAILWNAEVQAHRYPEGTPVIFFGPRGLADYDAQGCLLAEKTPDPTQVRRSGLIHEK